MGIKMKYEYQSLKAPTESNFWIRVATLLPGDAEIEISISDLSIDKNFQTRYDFQALSYCWGESSETVDIKVRLGAGDDASMTIGKSLYDALLNLRVEAPRHLWIDAICINEAPRDETEKAEKEWSIKQMHLIYGCASSVIVWLGLASPCSPLAMRVLTDIGHGIVYDEATYELQSQPNWGGIRATMTEEAYHAIGALLSRAWFARVWIRQEAFAAMPAGTIQCGQAVISVRNFCAACYMLNLMPDVGYSVPERLYERRLAETLGVFQRSFKSITSIMFQVRLSQCRFLHDKIYGCLGMMSLSGQSQFVSRITIDYDKPVEKVYRDFVISYTTQKFNLSMLNYAGLCQQSSLQIPSWVPDWSTSFHSLDLSFQAACSHAKFAEAALIGEDILQVEGVTCSTIQRLARWDKQDSPVDLTLEEACYLLCKVLGLDAHTSDSVITSAGYSFCSMFNNLSMSLEDIEAQREDFMEFFSLFMQHKRAHVEDQKPFDMTLRHASTPYTVRKAFRSFAGADWPWIVLEDGQYGVGCTEIRTGDMVAVVIGLVNVVILRPCGQGKFQLVGSAFVPKYNDGQGLLGSLPDGVEVRPRLVTSWGSYTPYYVNTSTDEASFWDPRLDWSELNINAASGVVAIVKAPPGEPTDRIAPVASYFRQRGVNVCDLQLV